MENLDPPPPPQKSRRIFALRAASSLIWQGWGFAVPLYFVQDCRLILNFHCLLALIIHELGLADKGN